MSWLIDPTGRILAGALDGLAQRQTLIASNMANIDTPGYRPQSVDFETTLRAELNADDENPVARRPPTLAPDAGLALRRTDPRHVIGSATRADRGLVTPFDGSLRNDGNRVDLDSEMSALAEDQLRFTSVSRLISARFGMLRGATTGGR